MIDIKTYFPLCLAFLISVYSCTKKEQQDEHTGHDPHAAHTEMHSAHADINGDTLHINSRLELLANIVIDTVQTATISKLDHLLGTAAVDQENVTLITSRAKGRIERLYIRNPGENIQKGQLLYQIYSEGLQTDINELALLLEQSEQGTLEETLSKKLLNASRTKLKLWGLTSKQIEEIEQKRIIQPSLSFYSPVSGVITELQIKEGEYVDIGSSIASIADLRTLWVETQVYSNEVAAISPELKVSISFDAYPSTDYHASLVFNNPALEENKKINLVRFRINNKDLKIKPGMMANVHFNRGNKNSVVIPKSSLVVGKMKFAWVKTGENMYERRMVETGVENVKEIEVLSGINEGELVVVAGGYLLSSELILRQGGGMGHDMEDM